jgi:flagellar biosynthesis protein FlhA
MADAARANLNAGSGAQRTWGLNNLLKLGPGGSINGSLMGLAVVVVLAMFIVPLPTVILDALMAFNFVLSLLVLLIVLDNKKPTDISLFPTFLLVITIFGLALNISSTRLILIQGSRFNGRMIKAFATFVVGSGGTIGLVVGFVIFIAIIAVQKIVITKGATRISEVAARFTLDGMPQKQMAIDTEYSSGAINLEEATAKKEALQRESDFFGAMDGASKFISGNITFAILIIVIDVLGGFIIGVALNGESLNMALATYTSLSIGDGLLSQLPALLVSAAMAIVVTRAAAPGDLGEQVSIQFSRNARAYRTAAVAIFGMAWLPGFPKYVLFPMSALLGFCAFKMYQAQSKQASFNEMMQKTGEAGRKPKDDKGDIPQMEPPDQLSLELGYGLIPLVDKDKGAELLERVKEMRRQIALDMGIVIPIIRIIDNIQLASSEYCFKIRGVDVGKSIIRMGNYLCIKPGTVKEELSGEKTTDPAFGLPAIWISEDKRDEAERAGYTVVDPPSIIATHLTEIIKHHAAELLGRQETQGLIDGLKKDYSAVVEEVTMGRDGKGLTMGNIQKVLQGLLKEQVSIRNMVSILESIADFAPLTTDTRFLVEKARQALSSQICHQYADDDRTLHVMTLEPSLEQRIVDSKAQSSSGEIFSALEPALHNAWIRVLNKSVHSLSGKGLFPVILCSTQARYLVKTALERELPEVAVLSVAEIAQDYKVESVGIIALEQEQ